MALVTIISLTLSLTATSFASGISQEQRQAQAVPLEKMRSMAEAQHEIVMIWMRKEEFSRAAEEANKIFEMNWPDDQEPLLVTELLGLSSQFTHHEKPAIALGLIEQNFKRFKDRKSLIALYKEMGYLAKRLGQDDRALDFFQKAHDLEKF